MRQRALPLLLAATLLLGAATTGAGRARVLDRFTMQQVAAQTVEVYRKLCTSS